jgi:PKD repeat protein
MTKSAEVLAALILLGLFAYPLQVSAQMNPPSPFYEYTPLTPRVGDTITFNATRFVNYWKESTNDPVPSLAWDFGDGTPSQTGVVLTHTFTSPGSYWVSIADASGLGQTSALEVKVGEQTPVIIYEDLSTDVVYIGQGVIISGNLTYNGKGVGGETVSFSTKVYLDEAPWIPIGTTQTQSDGSYSFTWETMHSSGYQVKAEWAGNATYPKTSLTRNLYVISYGDFITGFQSNSTITGLNYNSTTRLLSFTAEGPSGTSGCVNVTLKKDPSFNPQNLNVLLDGQPIPYTAESTEQAWTLYFTYNHSIHDILVDFTGAPAGYRTPDASPSAEIDQPPSFPVATVTAAVLVAVAAGMFAGLFVFSKKRRREAEQA